MEKLSCHDLFFRTRFTILSRFFVMLVLLFYKLSEHYSQTTFHIIKTKPFKVKKTKKKTYIFHICEGEVLRESIHE